MEYWRGKDVSGRVYKENYWGCNDVLFVEMLEKQWISRVSQACDNPIPCIIHFIWLGSTLPEKYVFLINSWRCFHPTWSVRIWSDDLSLLELPADILPHYHAATNFGMKSDILRYHILRTYGGVYVDIDYLCLKPLDNAIAGCDFFAGVSNTTTLELNNGIIGCRPGHPLIQAVITSLYTELQRLEAMRIFHRHISSDDQCVSLSTIATTGPGMFTRCVYQFLQKNSAHQHCRFFPATYFHPIPNIITVDICDEISVRNVVDQFAVDVSVAAHLWQKSWQ